MVYDFLVFRHHIAFVIGPMVCDRARVRRGGRYRHWDSTLPTRLVSTPRHRGASGIRGFDAPKVAMHIHTFTAREDGDTLVPQHFVNESGSASFPTSAIPMHTRSRPSANAGAQLDRAEGEVEISRFIHHISEIPMIDHRFAMRRTRHCWFGTRKTSLGPMLPFGPKGPPFACLGHFEEQAGTLESFYAGPDSAPEEPYLVPRSAYADEGDGWLLWMVGPRAEKRTDLVTLDARRLSACPVAVVKFSCRAQVVSRSIWVGAPTLSWAG